MRVYIDEDVHPEVKKRVERLGYKADRAQDVGLAGIKDELAYVEAVRRGYAFVITCNVAEEGGFFNEVRRHLGCKRDKLPIPIVDLWEAGTGNKWADIDQRWLKHERQIQHEARQLESIKPERQERRANEALNDLLEAKRQRETPQQPTKNRRDKSHDRDNGHER